jgi:hypothetical protein
MVRGVRTGIGGHGEHFVEEVEMRGTDHAYTCLEHVLEVGFGRVEFLAYPVQEFRVGDPGGCLGQPLVQGRMDVQIGEYGTVRAGGLDCGLATTAAQYVRAQKGAGADAQGAFQETPAWPRLRALAAVI